MKIGFITRHAKTLFGFALLFVLASAYQNCGQSYQVADSPEPDPIVHAMSETQPITSNESSVSVSAVAAATKIEKPICELHALRCLRKVYSPQVDDTHFIDRMCTQAGTCLDVESRTYGTRAALSLCEECGPEDIRPGGRYNREEVTCWMGEAGAASSKVYALRESLDAAVEATMAACHMSGKPEATK